MAVLFPKLRAWKNRLIRRLRFLSWRCRLRRIHLEEDPTSSTGVLLRSSGITAIDEIFPPPPPPLKPQDACCRIRGMRPVRWLIYPPSMEELPLPGTIEPNDAGNFAPSRIIRHPSAYVYKIPDGIYHGACGAVLDEKNRAFGDLLDANPLSFEPGAPRTEPHVGHGNVLALSCAANYYHWLIKMLPRLHLLEKIGMPASHFDSLLVSRPNSIHRAAYAMAGLSPGTLRAINSSEFWFCRQLYVPSIHHDIPDWSVNYLRKLFASALRPVAGNPKAIYLTRGGSDYRRVTNEDQVRVALGQHGFESIDCNRHTFEQQVQFIASADVIVGVHGAALANLAFAREGARVLEIFANRDNQKCYWRLARHRRAIYHYFLAHSLPSETDPNRVDLEIPLEKLNRAVDFLMQDSLAAEFINVV